METVAQRHLFAVLSAQLAPPFFRGAKPCILKGIHMDPRLREIPEVGNPASLTLKMEAVNLLRARTLLPKPLMGRGQMEHYQPLWRGTGPPSKPWHMHE